MCACPMYVHDISKPSIANDSIFMSFFFFSILSVTHSLRHCEVILCDCKCHIIVHTQVLVCMGKMEAKMDGDGVFDDDIL